MLVLLAPFAGAAPVATVEIVESSLSGRYLVTLRQNVGGDHQWQLDLPRKEDNPVVLLVQALMAGESFGRPIYYERPPKWVSGQQANLLEALSLLRQLGDLPVTAAKLQRSLDLPRASVHSALRRMEARGLLCRKGDGRAIDHVLTEDGERLRRSLTQSRLFQRNLNLQKLKGG